MIKFTLKIMNIIQKIGLSLLAVLEIFGSIALMIMVGLNLKKFSIKNLKILSVLGVAIQFLGVAYYIYISNTKPDNLDYSPSAILFLAYYFHIIPCIVITYILLIRLQFLLGLKVKASIIMLFVTTIPLYAFLNIYGSYILEVLAIKTSQSVAIIIGIFYSAILISYPAIRLFQVWKGQEKLVK